MRFLADLGERAVAVVVVQNIFSVVSDVQIFEAVVVVIADAHPLAPAGVSQSGFFRHIGEGAVVIVVVEVARRRFGGRQGFQFRPVHDENIRPAVIVVIKDGHAGARGFNDVFFCGFAAENYRSSETGFLRHVGEMHDGLCVGVLGLATFYSLRTERLHEEKSAKPKEARKPEKRGTERHQSLIIARSGVGSSWGASSAMQLVEGRGSRHVSIFENTLRVSVAWNRISFIVECALFNSLRRCFFFSALPRQRGLLQTIPRRIARSGGSGIFPETSMAPSANCAGRSNWSRNGRNCMTISARCWCRNPIRWTPPRNFPKHCGYSLISLKRIFTLAFCVSRKNPSTRPRNIFNQQYG